MHIKKNIKYKAYLIFYLLYFTLFYFTIFLEMALAIKVTSNCQILPVTPLTANGIRNNFASIGSHLNHFALKFNVLMPEVISSVIARNCQISLIICGHTLPPIACRF